MQDIDAQELTAAVPVEGFKRAVHIMASDVDDDDLFADYLLTAQSVVETSVRRLMQPRDYEFMPPCGAWRRWWFPVAPVVSVASVALDDGAGGWSDLDADEWSLVTAHNEPQLVLVSSADVQVRVRARVGHVDGGAPRGMRQAVMLLTKEWFEAGIAVGGEEVARPRLSMGVERLIRQVRYQRPCELAQA